MQSLYQGQLNVNLIGLQPYLKVLKIQESLQNKLIQNEIPETLLICEHPPIITFGKSSKKENLLISHEKLAKLSIELHQSNRGGDITCHSPGQVVLYPIFDLNFHKKDVAWYMRSLEEVAIRTLRLFKINGLRLPGKTGVWLSEKQKIASIGVKISRWRTMHGLALNVCNCTDLFKYINPCGYNDIEITEMQKNTNIILDKNEVTNSLVQSVIDVFNFKSVNYTDKNIIDLHKQYGEMTFEI